MQARSENYKGIEYVRISSLPVSQRETIYKSLNHNLIITILREDGLVKDCLQYRHYITWYENVFDALVEENLASMRASSIAPSLRLAFK
ncbi:MAG TPA: hypothetical protein VKQ08_03370 [Cyclobacteriaceae bacterium]|nr:hypothetical protein [Cyclobacteriaceae bacterium]